MRPGGEAPGSGGLLAEVAGLGPGGQPHWVPGWPGEECDFEGTESEVVEGVRVEMLVGSKKWGLDLGQRTKLALDFRITSVEVTDEDRGKSSRWGFIVCRGFWEQSSRLPWEGFWK